MKISDFYAYRKGARKISMVTAYDYVAARLAQESAVDCVLVGDSLAMVVHGYPSTTAATLEMMVPHVAAVRRGVKDKLLVADMPFLSFRKGKAAAAEAAGRLIQAGAEAVKLEGARGHEDAVAHLVQSGVPVMGHLGLTPQSVNAFGGYKVQGRGAKAAREMLQDAKALEAAGCFALVLECVPAALAAKITRALKIPVIGIGAGPKTDGQVLVIYDLLGFYKDLSPRFNKKYLEGYALSVKALNRFDAEIKGGQFPAKEHSYS
ncbi:MAG: 3-methyl-2-oxobutanoate hydroxymethyltransferase [Elusimicrobia bacterium]|nr:3-methyl-2-oxobutanoate hydroxymethyltransferase [Elusimicrobiota bacterium]